MRKKRVTAVLAIITMLGIAGCGNSHWTQNGETLETSTEETSMEETIGMSESDSKEAATIPESDQNLEAAQKPISETIPESLTGTMPTPTDKDAPNQTEESASHIHTYTETVTVQVDCATDGEKKLSCECGDEKVESIPATGKHNWVEQTTVVHHDAIGHTEEVQVQVGMTEERTVYACGVCGACFDTPSGVTDHCYATTLNNPDVALVSTAVGKDDEGNWLYRNVIGIDDEGNYIFEISTERKDWGTDTHWMATTICYDYPSEPIYETQSKWVVDQEAWDETVVTGYKCSVCGQQKK